MPAARYQRSGSADSASSAKRPARPWKPPCTPGHTERDESPFLYPRGRGSLSEGSEDGLANDKDAVAPRKVETTVLVLTRKTNQSIMIGDDVEISILSVSGDKVRIGIAAPREIGVFRKEVYAAREADDAKTPDASGDEGPGQ